MLYLSLQYDIISLIKAHPYTVNQGGKKGAKLESSIAYTSYWHQ